MDALAYRGCGVMGYLIEAEPMWANYINKRLNIAAPKISKILVYFLAIWIEPAGASDIVAAATGFNLVSFTPEPASFLKIKATEKNVGAISSMTVWLNVN